VDAYQARSSTSKVIETVADMKRFVEEYPEFRKLGGNVSKHVAVVGELSRLVARNKLLDVSEAEQVIVGSGSTHVNDLKTVQALIQDPQVLPVNKLRLAMLYALRYQRNSGNAIPAVVELLTKNGVNESESKVSHLSQSIHSFINMPSDSLSMWFFISLARIRDEAIYFQTRISSPGAEAP
jgi:hypothetical protein